MDFLARRRAIPAEEVAPKPGCEAEIARGNTLRIEVEALRVRGGGERGRSSTRRILETNGSLRGFDLLEPTESSRNDAWQDSLEVSGDPPRIG